MLNPTESDSKTYYVWVYGEPVLTTPASPVPADCPIKQIWATANLLASTIVNLEGSAIAAPQADISSQIFIVKNEAFDNSNFNKVLNPGFPYQLFINPTVRQLIPKGNEQSDWTCTVEGCLSFPGYSNGCLQPGNDNNYSSINTSRYSSFIIEYDTLEYMVEYEEKTKVNANLYTRVKKSYTGDISSFFNQQVNWILQHETDHINGILFTTRCIVPPDTANQDYLATISDGTCHAQWSIIYPNPNPTSSVASK
jgi:peptide deformylase